MKTFSNQIEISSGSMINEQNQEIFSQLFDKFLRMTRKTDQLNGKFQKRSLNEEENHFDRSASSKSNQRLLFQSSSLTSLIDQQKHLSTNRFYHISSFNTDNTNLIYLDNNNSKHQVRYTFYFLFNHFHKNNSEQFQIEILEDLNEKKRNILIKFRIKRVPLLF
jgi:hypothetical protein